MADVRPGLGGISGWSIRSVSSGARFHPGDVLVARITPCLENGKVARVPESFPAPVGHGSTEFLVVRGREGESESGFLHYLLSSSQFFAYAVPRMTGSSGRQRLPADQLSAMPVVLPAVPEQQRIARQLSLFDGVESAYRAAAEKTMALLDSIWQQVALETSEICRVGEVVSLDKGVSYKGEYLGRGRPLINLANFGSSGVFNRSATKSYAGDVRPHQCVSPGQLLMSNTDLTQRREVLARPALVPRDVKDAVTSHHTYAIRSDVKHREWLYGAFRTAHFHAHAISYATGTTVAALPRDGVLDYKMPWPGQRAMMRFAEIARKLIDLHDHLTIGAEQASRARRESVPLLLSGQVVLSDSALPV